MGALRFSTNVYTEFRLDRYVNPAARDGSEERRLMKEHIDRMEFEGSETNISGAIRQARWVGEGRGGERGGDGRGGEGRGCSIMHSLDFGQ